MQKIFLRRATLFCLQVCLLAVQSASAISKEPRTFHHPTLRGIPLDRCLTWATDCGEPAASVFCRDRGFSRVAEWNLENASPTLVPGDGLVCSGEGCKSFIEIRCE